MDFLFWTALILIALFYIFKGNDMHKQIDAKRAQNMQQNSNK